MSDQDKPGLEPEEPTPPTSEETPAWERTEAQSPRVEEPDGWLHNNKGKAAAIAASLFVLLVLLPIGCFGVVSCGIKNEVQKHNNEFNRQFEQDLNQQLDNVPGVTGEAPSEAEKQFQQETDQLPPDAVSPGQNEPSAP